MNKKSIKKIAVVIIIAALAGAYHFFHLGQYLTLTYIKESQENFAHLYSEHRIQMIGGYMALYILITSVSLPGAAVLTIAGGALFGLWTGSLVVSFASSIGATLACFVARFLLRDWLQSRFGNRIIRINEGIEKEGAFYLFTLRLVPVFPFWMINLLMGLTNMPLRRFYWISQVGMFPATVVYVNAGKELSKIDSLSGILSPGLILSFVLIGVFPIVVKRLVFLFKK